MTTYGQFCPVAKATEIVGEKWTLSILRELLLGTHRLNDFQRSMSRISPTILTKRLKQLEDKGIVTRKRVSGQDGHEYRLTPMGRDVELFLASDIRTMNEVWQGDIELADALAEERILATGDEALRRAMPDWFGLCIYAPVKSMAGTEEAA